MRHTIHLAALALVASAAPAAAQTYVSGGIGAAVTRSYSTSGDGYTSNGNDAEVLSWMLRVGTSLNNVFGVELEFARDAKVDVETSAVPLFDQTSFTIVGAGTSFTSSPVIFPTPQFETNLRTTTWNATAFVRKPIASRTELVFLGGIGVSRVVQHSHVSFDPRLLPIRISDSTSTAYGIGPIVGAEARIGMTEHLRLTPGFRVQSLGNDLTDGIDLRPSVTLGWTF